MTCRRFHIRRLFYIALVEFCTVNSVATIFLPATERTREQFVLDALVALHVDELLNPQYVLSSVYSRLAPQD